MFRCFIALVLSQFQPGEFTPITVDAYSVLSAKQKAADIQAVIRDLEAEPQVSPFVDPPRSASEKKAAKDKEKAAREAEKKGKAELEKYALDKSKIHDLPLFIEQLEPGKIGILTEEYGHKPGQIKTIAVKVTQDLGESGLLCKRGERILLIRGINAENIVDDAVIDVPWIMIVSGKYSYQTVLGAKKTVFAIEPWKFEKEWEAAKKKLIDEAAVEAEQKKKTKPATSTKKSKT